MTFEELRLSDQLIEALDYMGFVDATPIQEQAIPMILAGKDLVACAQTGTGKTAAFVLPILHKLAVKPSKNTTTLVICPTRELAIQIDKQIQGLAYFVGASSVAVYGGGDGDDFTTQKRALTQGCNIIVATPGKLISHLNLGYVKFNKVEHLILDEADRMLDMGFFDDIQKICSYLPKKRQNLMFSATMASKLRKLANEILHQPESISIALAKPAEGVLQAAYVVYDNQKTPLIKHLLKDKDEYKSILIFTSTKKNVSVIARELRKQGFQAEGISSDLDQQQREEVLLKFTNKEVRILVATDVLSRGVDIKDINLVINYDVPGDAADYVHRIGRTARASTTGVALTLINQRDMYKFNRIEELIDAEVNKIPLPADLGDAPKYEKNAKKESRFPASKGKSNGGGNKKSSGNNTNRKSSNNKKRTFKPKSKGNNSPKASNNNNTKPDNK